MPPLKPGRRRRPAEPDDDYSRGERLHHGGKPPGGRLPRGRQHGVQHGLAVHLQQPRAQLYNTSDHQPGRQAPGARGREGGNCCPMVSCPSAACCGGGRGRLTLVVEEAALARRPVSSDERMQAGGRLSHHHFLVLCPWVKGGAESCRRCPLHRWMCHGACRSQPPTRAAPPTGMLCLPACSCTREVEPAFLIRQPHLPREE